MLRINSFMSDIESENGRRFFLKMLRWLDNPKRLKYNNPDKLVRGSGIQPGQIVLEIGCGSGFFTPTIAKILGERGSLCSIDIHPLAMEKTQKKVNELGLKNVMVKKDDAVKTSFEDSIFDLVLLYGVVPSPVIPMKDISLEIHRVLKPGGICAIWTMVPFWTPRALPTLASFKVAEKQNGVFRLRKI